VNEQWFETNLIGQRTIRNQVLQLGKNSGLTVKKKAFGFYPGILENSIFNTDPTWLTQLVPAAHQKPLSAAVNFINNITFT